MDADAVEWMVPADIEILKVLDETGMRLSAKVLGVNTEYHQSYARRRCQKLKRAGLIFKDENKLYVITPFGEQALAGEVAPNRIVEGPPEVYTGERREGEPNSVTADKVEVEVELRDRVDFGFTEIDDYTWGYEGGGAVNLALALLGDVADGQVANQYANQFMKAKTSELDGSRFELQRSEIEVFLEEIE